MSDQMEFPETFEKFAKDYGFKDTKEVYTNGIDLIPIFRVKQWLEHLQSNSDEDCISRKAVLDAIEDDNRNGNYSCFASNNDAECFKDVIRSLSSATPKPKTDVLDKIRAVVIRWQTDTWTDNLSHECMRKIADILPVKIRNESEEEE